MRWFSIFSWMAIYLLVLTILVSYAQNRSGDDYNSSGSSGCSFNDDLLCNEIVRKAMLKSWDITKNGKLDIEHGFAVIRKEYDYAVVFSPNDNYDRMARIPFLKGSIAIFHVHPSNMLPEPS